ncbi:hypothetical protein [Streptomyces luteireticuli]|uniref:hypothetical protein n=1 Tax=Streptomyces luteireticuli TaxID=173858 RepID=UPI0035573BC7
MTERRFPYLLGHGEISKLYGVERQTSQLWKTRELLPQPDVTISGNPYWLLPTVLGIAKKGERDVLPAQLKQYKQGIRGGFVADSPADMPDVIGLHEVAWLVGKGYMDVYQWRVRKSLATEDALVSGSPLWLLDTVLADAEERGREILPDAVKRIKAGEREPIKPRGRKKAEPAQGKQKPLAPLPEAKSFSAPVSVTDDAVAEVSDFVRELFEAGHAVTVRPKRR